MTARYCPNCDAQKEVSELKDGNEVICVCLTCGNSFSFTENKQTLKSQIKCLERGFNAITKNPHI